MAEHDEALLDEDLASLPDINNEEDELDNSNANTTISTQESTNEQLSCEFKSSIEDILELTDLDSFEELEKNVVSEPESKSSHIINIKQENIDTDYSIGDNYTVHLNDENTLPIDEINLSKTNCVIETICTNGNQYESSSQVSKNIFTNDSVDYQQIQSLEKEYGPHRFDRCVSNENHSYIQATNMFYSPSFYQSYLQDERTPLNLNNSSFLNEPYSVDPLANQPIFCYNHNTYTNNGYQFQVPTCLYHSPCQRSTFINQASPMQQSIQISHGHIPIMRNPCQTILVDSNSQIMCNQRNMVSNYLDSAHYDQPMHTNLDHPEYVLNPLYNQNRSTKQKILVNRYFNQTQSRRESSLHHEFDKTDLFLKKIASKKIINQKWKSSSHSRNNDPYSYFSDIWQPKDNCESSKHRRSFSPEISSHTDILKSKEHRSNKDCQPERKRIKMCESSTSYSSSRTSNLRNEIRKTSNDNRRKKQESGSKTKNIVENHKIPMENRNKNADEENKKEENLDPEMIEYRKKIEEQKRQRDKFLQEKEIRRQQLAMEKVGIKRESFADNVL